eukprot:CAMPEP_0114973418 /NCGR_PEP_ID=MMETSP0216-20121206/941_1 /TAXON_ID=223996 /ORGANISM="Protocruzia adherens, Strain Boccale" /LENGTH=607 /DNA_ID=CAMNT_0002333903 /DNA_START=99 /DNA_END=1920 /DNA_ORIENTATION=+
MFMMDMEVIGAIKVKDGLFLGDEFAAQDLEFVVANKVTHIINCAARQIPNHWEPIGVNYLSYYWFDNDSQIILDAKDQVGLEVFRFIESATANGESCLVHSVRGQNRTCTVLAAYLMRKYKWTLLKTLEFLNSRRPDMEIRPSFVNQLANYESRLAKTGNGAKSARWLDLADDSNHLESEEMLLRNTYLNSQMGPFADFSQVNMNEDKKFKLKWTDDGADDPARLCIIPPSSSRGEFHPTHRTSRNTHGILALKPNQPRNLYDENEVNFRELKLQMEALEDVELNNNVAYNDNLGNGTGATASAASGIGAGYANQADPVRFDYEDQVNSRAAAVDPGLVKDRQVGYRNEPKATASTGGKNRPGSGKSNGTKKSSAASASSYRQGAKLNNILYEGSSGASRGRYAEDEFAMGQFPGLKSTGPASKTSKFSSFPARGQSSKSPGKTKLSRGESPGKYKKSATDRSKRTGGVGSTTSKGMSSSGGGLAYQNYVFGGDLNLGVGGTGAPSGRSDGFGSNKLSGIRIGGAIKAKPNVIDLKRPGEKSSSGTKSLTKKKLRPSTAPNNRPGSPGIEETGKPVVELKGSIAHIHEETAHHEKPQGIIDKPGLLA